MMLAKTGISPQYNSYPAFVQSIKATVPLTATADQTGDTVEFTKSNFTDLQTGDILIMFAGWIHNANITAFVSPSGWTAISTGLVLKKWGLWYRIVDGTEPATITLGKTGGASNQSRSGVITQIRGGVLRPVFFSANQDTAAGTTFPLHAVNLINHIPGALLAAFAAGTRTGVGETLSANSPITLGTQHNGDGTSAYQDSFSMASGYEADCNTGLLSGRSFSASQTHTQRWGVGVFVEPKYVSS